MILRKRRYENGGDQNEDQTERDLNKGLGILSVGATIADSIDAPNQYGNQGEATTVLKSAASFAQLGSTFGPAGAVLGGIGGAVKGVIDARKVREEEARMRRIEGNARYTKGISEYAARAAADPTLASGVKGANYFENGGSIFSKFMQRKMHGGSLSQLSSDTMEVRGRSHAEGGVDLPTGEEVERGETIKGRYVFSDKLGFAAAHKPIAKAIGILEKKTATAPVLNSIERLREKEQALVYFQESYRKQHNLA